MSVRIDEGSRAATEARPDFQDTPPDAILDDIAGIAACALRCPIVVISLLESDRIWLRPERDDGGLARRTGLCGTAVKAEDPWVIRNATADPYTLANPLVAGRAGLHFYVGVPLRGRDGHSLGTIAAIDEEPRPIGDAELSILKKLAGLVVDVLDLRLEQRMAGRGATGQSGRVT